MVNKGSLNSIFTDRMMSKYWRDISSIFYQMCMKYICGHHLTAVNQELKISWMQDFISIHWRWYLRRFQNLQGERLGTDPEHYKDQQKPGVHRSAELLHPTLRGEWSVFFPPFCHRLPFTVESSDLMVAHFSMNGYLSSTN